MTTTKTTTTKKGGFRPPGTEAKQRAAEQHKAERAARKLDLIARMQGKYQTEPDRAYADEVWGTLLREQGVEPISPPQ